MEPMLYERPDAAYRKQVADNARLPEFRKLADRLVRDGYIVVPNLYTGDRLAELQAEFERMVRTNPYVTELTAFPDLHPAVAAELREADRRFVRRA